MLKNILIPVDGSETSLKALQFAMELGKDEGSALMVVHVDIPYDLNRLTPKTKFIGGHPIKIPAAPEAPKPLEVAKKEAEKFGYDKIQFKELIATDAAERICEKAEQMKADLIVMGNRGYGMLTGLFMGSVSMKVSQNSKCPITIVK